MRKSHTVTLFAAIWIAVFMANAAIAQDDGDPITIGHWQSLESEILGETRRLMVYTPDGYEDGGDHTYPVLYLLDGDAHFHHTTGLAAFLAQTWVDAAPEMIVVAVLNTDRTRDLTPPLTEPDMQFPTAGGADRFIRFFNEELIPHVDNHYRTHPYRVLVGHSFGGLFAIHTLLNAPDTFDAYIAISPSLQWDDQALVAQAGGFFEVVAMLDKTLYITTGGEGGALTGGARKLEGILLEHTPEEMEWDVYIMPEETHNSVVYRSTRQGLEFVYRDWSVRDVVEAYDHGGLPAIHAQYERASERYGIERSTPLMKITELSLMLGFAGRLDEARSVLEHDPERFPPVAMAYSFLGDQYREAGNHEAAIDCYVGALELNPTDTAARQALTELGVDPDTVAGGVFNMPQEVLDRYAGRYTDGSGWTATLRPVDGDLHMSTEGQAPMILTPIAVDRFVTADQPVEFVFITNEAGETDAISIQMAGEELVQITRIE